MRASIILGVPVSKKVFKAVAKEIVEVVKEKSLFYCTFGDYDIQDYGSGVEICFRNRNMRGLGTEIRVAFKKDQLVLKVTGQYRKATAGLLPVMLGDPDLGETLAKRLDDVGLNMIKIKLRTAEKMVKRTARAMQDLEDHRKGKK